MVPIVGGIALVGVAAVLAVVFMGKREKSARPAAADTTRPAAPAVPTAPPAPAAATAPSAPDVGYVRVSGDLPDCAILWLDQSQVRGRVFPASPGVHTLEVETAEFQPWDTKITVRAGDTLRVRVELELKPPPDSTQ